MICEPVMTISQGRKPLQQKQRRSARRWFLGILVVLFIFYGTAGYMATSQVMGDHRSWREFIARPTDFGLKAEVVSFNSQDGIPLKGWWLPAEGPAHWNLVLVHGKDGNRSHML